METSTTIVCLSVVALFAYGLYLDRLFEAGARAGIYEFFIKLKNRKK